MKIWIKTCLIWKAVTDNQTDNQSIFRERAIHIGMWGDRCIQVLRGETRAQKEPSGDQMLQEDQDTQTEKRAFEEPASLNEKAKFECGILIIRDACKYNN